MMSLKFYQALQDTTSVMFWFFFYRPANSLNILHHILKKVSE